MGTNKTQELGTKPVGKLFLKLAAPAVAAQIINLLYNLVDRMYIGRIEGVGLLALTGVGVCLPLIMLISAFAALVGMGAAPRASIFMGKGEKDNAEKTLGNSFTCLIVISIVLTVVFSLFAEELLLAFGASAETVPYGKAYFEIYAMGTIFVQMTLGLNAFISAQGFTSVSMKTVLIGAVTNIILDPIFIFGFDMGVEGAAWATIISQAISMVWILIFLTGKKTTLRIQKKNMRLIPKIILPAMALGLAPFIMQATESLVAVAFNTSLRGYGGDLAVATMTVLLSVNQFAMLPLMGMSQGAQPIISYNFGANNVDRVKKAFKIQLIVCLVYSTVLWVAVQLVPEVFIRLFNDDPALVAYGTSAMRTYMGVSLLFGAQIACQQTFIAIGDAKCSLFLALLRKIILLIPLIYIMPMFFQDKVFAVFFAEPVADFLAVATTVTLFTVQFKKAMKKMDSKVKG